VIERSNDRVSKSVSDINAIALLQILVLRF